MSKDITNDIGRIGELDGLRGIAAIGVVVYHYTSDYDRVWGHSNSFTASFPIGAWGVQLFFVISGFVVLMTLEKTPRIASFVRNRCARLFPAYWLAIFITLGVVHSLGLPGRERSPFEALVNATMLQGFVGIENVDGPYWTLHVELCFYVLMGIVVLCGGSRLIIHIITFAAIVGLLNAKLGWWSEWTGVWRLERAWPLRHHLPFFLYGLVLYKIRMHGWKRHGIWLAIALALLMVSKWHWMSLLVACVMLVCTQFKVNLLTIKPLLFLGTISYSLYLIHANVGYALIYNAYQLGIPPIVSVSIASIVALTLSLLITFGVEKPMSRFLRQTRIVTSAATMPAKSSC